MNGLVNAKKVAWCKGKNTPLPLLWLEFDSHTWGHMWIEFVVGSSPCYVGFSPGPWGFIPLQKPTSQLPICLRNSGQEEPPCGMQPA